MIEGQIIIYSYDKEGDVLEIIFQRGGGSGVDLTENIVLRYNQERAEPLSLILTNPARVIEPTPFGPPSFPLTALTELPYGMQRTILHLLNSFPVNRFLKVSGLRLSPGDELHYPPKLHKPYTMRPYRGSCIRAGAVVLPIDGGVNNEPYGVQREYLQKKARTMKVPDGYDKLMVINNGSGKGKKDAYYHIIVAVKNKDISRNS